MLSMLPEVNGGGQKTHYSRRDRPGFSDQGQSHALQKIARECNYRNSAFLSTSSGIAWILKSRREWPINPAVVSMVSDHGPRRQIKLNQGNRQTRLGSFSGY